MSDKATLCNCTEKQCNADPKNKFVHIKDECIHLDGTRHKISLK